MKLTRRIARDQRGVTTVETAFALPVLIIIIWCFVQLAQVYRAMAGIQQALGQGARYATLCFNPTATGCAAPTATDIKTQITNSVFGIGPGTFVVSDPVLVTSGTSQYFDLRVNYSQLTSLLLLPGPTINVSRSKRVWIAAAAPAAAS